MRLAVLDNEIGPGLCRYILARRKEITPVLCSCVEDLEASRYDAAVVSISYREDMGHLSKPDGTGPVIYLDETAVSEDEDVLYIYQTADQLIGGIRKIMLRYGSSSAGVLGHGVRDSRIICFCAPLAKEFLSGFSYVYAGLLAEKEKTLYMNFTYHDGLFERSYPDVGDLMYELNKGDRDAGEILNALVSREGELDYIYPAGNSFDLEDMSVSDYEALIDRLRSETEYKNVVAALPESTAVVKRIYEKADEMYCLTAEGTLYEESLRRFKDDIGGLDGGDTGPNERFHVITVPDRIRPLSSSETLLEELMFGETAMFLKNHVK